MVATAWVNNIFLHYIWNVLCYVLNSKEDSSEEEEEEEEQEEEPVEIPSNADLM